jgi:hypothetical protein
MLILTLQLILCFSGCSNQRDEIFKKLSCLHFYIFKVVFNSQLLVFYSEKRNITTYGYASNWNTTGYVEFHYLERKHWVKVLPKSAVVSQGQHKEIMITNHFIWTEDLVWITSYIEKFMGRRKADEKLIFQELFNISHTFLFKMN